MPACLNALHVWLVSGFKWLGSPNWCNSTFLYPHLYRALPDEVDLFADLALPRNHVACACMHA
jgi:hypothetical protein